MQALINSYTPQVVIVLTMPTVDFIDFSEQPKITMSSTTVSSSKDSGLNIRIHKLLEEFRNLENNWDNDEALAPSTEALKHAEFLTKVLDKHGQPIFHTAPGPNGEVMMDLRNKDKTRSVEIIFYPTRSTAVFYPNQDQPYQKDFDFKLLSEILEWLN